MRIGIIGTGVIGEAIAEGYCSAGLPDLRVTISPRNQERAKRLSEKYPAIIVVAKDNQEVVDSSDWVFFSLLSERAEEILQELHFAPEKKFINIVTDLRISKVKELIGEREIIGDVVPLTFVAERFGPVVVYPRNKELEEFIGIIGTPVVVDTPKQTAVLRAATGIMCSYYKLLEVLTDWCVKNGLDEPEARAYLTEFIGALSKKAAGYNGPLGELASEMTEGGLNWMCQSYIAERGGFSMWAEILDPVLSRVDGD